MTFLCWCDKVLNMNNQTRSSHGFSNFTGTIDQLLSHCATVDINQLQSDIDYERLVADVCQTHDCDPEQAERIIKNAMDQCLQKELNTMVKNGIVAIVGYDENGEPLYALAENNKKSKKNKKR